MSPPIDIDGSQIQQATIDGQDVSEITIDGQQAADFNVIPDSGITRYTFDDANTSNGIAVDVWGNNDANIIGATTGVSGQIAEAYSLDGTDDYVETPINPSNDLSNSGFTISFYLKPNDWNDGDFSGMVSAQDSSNDLFVLGQDQNGGINWQINGNGIEQANVGFDNGTYNFICARYDSSIGYLLDTAPAGGSLTSFSNSSTDIVSVDEVLYIGGINRNGSFRESDSVGGDYDDVRFHGKTLSDSEVSDLFNRGSI